MLLSIKYQFITAVQPQCLHHGVDNLLTIFCRLPVNFLDKKCKFNNAEEIVAINGKLSACLQNVKCIVNRIRLLPPSKSPLKVCQRTRYHASSPAVLSN